MSTFLLVLSNSSNGCTGRIDDLHPDHRRDDPQARSNLDRSDAGHRAQETRPADAVFAFDTITTLVQGMCTPEGGIDGSEDTEKTFYKLNLVGLLTEEQTLEWRQHAGTTDPNKVR